MDLKNIFIKVQNIINNVDSQTDDQLKQKVFNGCFAYSLGVTIVSYIAAFRSDFGLNYNDMRTDSGELGACLIIIILALSIMVKDFRKYLTKKTVLLLIVALLINLPIAIVCIINRSA